ncbi:MAG TPA: SDR family NAD(P)-dependent oxidoreductase [Solirubrobacteraceae bacterium]|jgi:NAD(P)-dependent dehydrogenase (short-subunit alcohol dehydrogenase family)|nr:SDR family NAD(P)-dependent oxidoreductase [Solirubrobacteraceae bacterium]
MSLQGATALITGAGSGIGRGVALRAGKEGMNVVVADIKGHDKVAEEIMAAGGQASAAPLDVRDPLAWEEVVGQATSDYEKIDLLVNNAGVVSEGLDNAVDQSDEQWDRVISINLKGYFNGMRAVMPSMIEAGGGAIVNVSSVAGLVGMVNVFTYSAAKGGVIGMSRQAAVEYAKSGIRVNVICPGIIETPILGDITDELRAHCEAFTPVARLGKPDDIAAMAIHLGKPESAFVTGQVIAVDGGWTAQ